MGHAQIGTTGLSFLKLGVSGRALGMGEAYAAVASDPAATYYNPSALSLIEKPQLLFSHKEWIQGAKTEFIAGAVPLGDLTVGIGVNATSVNDIELRDVPGPPLATFSARNTSIGISAAYIIDTTFYIGATGKFLYEKILVYDASGFGADVGGTYKTPWDVRVGLSVSNLGSVNKLENVSTKLPVIVRFGGMHQRTIESFDGTLTIAFDVVSVSGEKKAHPHIGAEMNFKQAFAVRAGYQGGYEGKNVSAGVGIHYDLLHVDYAYVPFQYDLGTTHTISLIIDFH